jgi:hypothetical protein
MYSFLKKGVEENSNLPNENCKNDETTHNKFSPNNSYLIHFVAPLVVEMKRHLQAVQDRTGPDRYPARFKAWTGTEGNGRPSVDRVGAVDERKAFHVIKSIRSGSGHEPLRVARVFFEFVVDYSYPSYLRWEFLSIQYYYMRRNARKGWKLRRVRLIKIALFKVGLTRIYKN